MSHLRSAALATLLGACSVLAGTKLTAGSKCPQDNPCASQYGECGVGAYCLGGCDPLLSYSMDACMPAPVCQDTTTTFSNLDSVVDISKYLGDASKADWVSQGQPLTMNGNVLLTMPKNSVGTVLASTSYMWYGNVKARMKTSRGQGVVTAFILMSDVKDEIDYEWVGVDLGTAQTNYYFQGITDYHNSGNITDVSDTFENFHDYEINWTPEQIQWLVDGKVGRTKKRSDTWNETSQNWQFPQTPARVQLSIWPGGLASNAQGTIDWAGGVIDWNAEDIKNAGYFYATVSDITIQCYNATSPPGTNSGKSYTYKGTAGTNNTVVDGDEDTILFSLDNSGLSNPSAVSSSSGPKNTGSTIPGGSSGGSGNDHSGDNTGSSGGSSGDSGANSGNCASNTFNQDCGSATGDSKGKNSGSKASASALAIVIAAFAVYWL